MKTPMQEDMCPECRDEGRVPECPSCLRIATGPVVRLATDYAPTQLGLALKDAGMAAADGAEQDTWKTLVNVEIARLALVGREFTAEDIRAVCGDPDHPNAFGARFNAAARRGVIRKVGYRNSSRPTLHAHPIAVWVGV